MLRRWRARRKMRWAVRRLRSWSPQQRRLFEFHRLSRRIWRSQRQIDAKLVQLYAGADWNEIDMSRLR